jgi:hypothetical protein
LPSRPAPRTHVPAQVRPVIRSPSVAGSGSAAATTSRGATRAGDGRLGPLLARGERARAINNEIAARMIFRANVDAERELLAELPAQLDRVDAWIADGVLDGPELNAADYMIAPSLALIAYRLDLRAQIEARPGGAFVERVLPEPSLSGG